MTLVKAKSFVALTILETIVLGGFLAWSTHAATNHDTTGLAPRRELVRRLGLTDLAIWTEARYTRHPSQADLFAPFQDGPSSLEHFPAGSVVAAPDRLTVFDAED